MRNYCKSTRLCALFGVALAVGTIVALSAGAAEKHAQWGYGPENGPAKWASLSTHFKTCGMGKMQSPIDVPKTSSTRQSKIRFTYTAGSATVVNNGHTVQVNVSNGNFLTVGNERFELLQFHFHTPSENTVQGKRFPMEMHLVHRSAAGKLAVVAVMIKTGGNGNPIDMLPTPPTAGDKVMLSGTMINPIRLLPPTVQHYAFSGSLTTPPCTEGVRWFVMARPVRVSAGTIKRFHAVLGNNNRPVRPLNSRKIILSR